MRQATEALYQALIDAEATDVIGAGRWERSPQRTNQRNGTRHKTITTTAGDLELQIRQAAIGLVLPGAAGYGAAGLTRHCSR